MVGAPPKGRGGGVVRGPPTSTCMTARSSNTGGGVATLVHRKQKLLSESGPRKKKHSDSLRYTNPVKKSLTDKKKRIFAEETRALV